MEDFPPPFNREIASRYHLNFQGPSGERDHQQVLYLKTTPEFVEPWFVDHIRYVIWSRWQLPAGWGEFELNYAHCAYHGIVLHLWIPTYFLVRDDPEFPLIPKVHNLGTALYLRAVPLSLERTRLIGYCYTPHLLDLFNALFADASNCWEKVELNQVDAPALSTFPPEPKAPASARAGPTAELKVDNRKNLEHTSTDLPNEPAKRRRGGQRPPTEEYIRQLVEDWYDAQDRMTQEAFCRSKHIASSTLRAYMRAGNYPSKREDYYEQAG
jgi:hypothetical protein